MSATSRSRRTSRSRAGPSVFPSQPSSSRIGSDHDRSARGRAARRKARSLRVATRSWWRSSGSEPSRVPGSCRSSWRTCSSSATPSAASAGASGGGVGAGGRNVELERPEELRPELGGRCRTRAAKLLREAAERVLVAADELDLELAEATGDALADEDGDGVLDDLGAVREDSLPPRLQARDRHHLATAEVRDEKPEHLDRRPRGRAGLLELDPRGTTGELQLPEPRTVLHAAPERDPVPCEREVGRVVVGGDERAQRQQLAAELGKHEPRARLELQLPLDGLLHVAERIPARTTARPQRVFGCLVSVNVRARAHLVHAEDGRVLRPLRPRRAERAPGGAPRRPPVSRASELGNHAGAGQGRGDRGGTRSRASSSRCSTRST